MSKAKKIGLSLLALVVVGAVIASRTPGEEVVMARGELLDIRLDQALSIGGKPARP